MGWFDQNQQHDGWRWATWGERRLRDMLLAITLQNEAILAKLEARDSKLSPEDQAKLNQIFDRATATTAKIDEAISTTDPAPGGTPAT